MKVIFIGDLVGKIARQALKEILPEWRKKYAPDFVVVNGENMAHGIGMTNKTVDEVLAAGVDVITSGDHAFDKAEEDNVFAGHPNVLRPANWPPGVPGQGVFLAVNKQKSLLVVNLIGRVFLRQHFDCPFRKLDEILGEQKSTPILIDFHAEATSEKNVMGLYADGRVSAVLGTHTHIGTVDTKVLPQGTAFVTDAGMVGAVNSVIGDEKESVLDSILHQTKFKLEPVESGACQIGAVLIEIDEETNKAKSIKRIDEEIYIE